MFHKTSNSLCLISASRFDPFKWNTYLMFSEHIVVLAELKHISEPPNSPSITQCPAMIEMIKDLLGTEMEWLTGICISSKHFKSQCLQSMCYSFLHCFFFFFHVKWLPHELCTISYALFIDMIVISARWRLQLESPRDPLFFLRKKKSEAAFLSLLILITLLKYY